MKYNSILLNVVEGYINHPIPIPSCQMLIITLRVGYIMLPRNVLRSDGVLKQSAKLYMFGNWPNSSYI